MTQDGFPWGRSLLRYTTDPDQPPTLEGDPNRFAELALLYSQLANSDRVLKRLNDKDGEAIVAKVVPVSQFSSTPLPLVDITGKAASPSRARELAVKSTRSLVDFISSSQAKSRTPVAERVLLQVIDPAKPGKLVSAPSPALPIIVLMTLLLVTFGTVFIRDNWQRGVTTVALVADEAAPDIAVPRIALTEPAPAMMECRPSRRGQRSGRWPADVVGHQLVAARPVTPSRRYARCKRGGRN